MMLGLDACNNGEKKDVVFNEFKLQTEKKGIKIDSIDKTGLIHISRDGWKLKVSLDNIRRDFERDSDKRQIANFVQTIFSSTVGFPSTWAEVKDSIYISLFPNHDFSFDSVLHNKITDEFSQVYVHCGDGVEQWITSHELAKWNIDESELARQAKINADKLLSQTEISFDTIEDHKLGMIEVERAALKAALLFAPGMKERIKKDFGFPFYAVIPVRDFCYLFSEKDFDFFSGRIGTVVVDEYKKSGHPITTEVLKFSDKGVEAVGKYPTE